MMKVKVTISEKSVMRHVCGIFSSAPAEKETKEMRPYERIMPIMI